MSQVDVIPLFTAKLKQQKKAEVSYFFPLAKLSQSPE
jgi:hypothetical protein